MLNTYLNISAQLGHAGLLASMLSDYTKFHPLSSKPSHTFGCRIKLSDQIAHLLQNYSAEVGGLQLGMLDKALHFNAPSLSEFPFLFFFKEQNYLQNTLSFH